MKFDDNSLYNIKSSLDGKRYSLFDLATWKNGLAFKKIHSSETGVPVIKIAELNNGIGGTTAYTQQVFSEDVHINKGDLLFSWSGNPQTSIDIFRFNLEEGWLNQHIFKVTPDEKVIDRNYFYFLMKNLKPHFTQIATNKQTTGLGHVTIADIKRMSVIVPSLPVQKEIVSYIKPIDDKIELNNEINNNLEQQAQALFVAWFVNFIPFGGTVPDDWQYVRFANFLTPRTEKSNDPSLPMFSVTDTGIYPRDEKFKKNLSMSNTKNKVIYNTDLVFGMSREILNWGIMRYAIGGVSSAYNVFSVNDTINSFYLESYIKHNGSYFRDLIKPASREGQGIDKNVLMQKQILLPPFDVLQSYYSIENALTRKVAYNQAENARLAELRDTLLPRLMTGEIDVSNINI